MKIEISQIKTLREKTKAGYADCKKSLVESNGDLEEAEKILRRKGHTIIEGHIITDTDQGVICSYVHPGDRVGVLVEVKCKTDFVAKTEEFKQFAKEMAMQVAAMKPQYVSRADVPLDVISQEVGYRIGRLARDGMTEEDEEFQKLLDAEMDHWYAEICLLEQLYVRDGRKNVKDLLAELISQVDETCRVSRFERWEIGFEDEKEKVAEMPMPSITNKFKPWALLILLGLGLFVLALVLGV
jgi:elongation factor Ts